MYLHVRENSIQDIHDTDRWDRGPDPAVYYSGIHDGMIEERSV